MPMGITTLAEWLAWFETLHPKLIDMSLDRIRVILETLRLREPPYRVITVGGTNGKGSCVAILEAIYRHAGYRVGAFTSPHLWRFNERIRFDARDATDGELITAFEEIEASLGSVTLSYFEASAVAALLHFEHKAADVAVLEVGMGGRLDAVNALDADAALITNVALDHMEWLGGDRETIGREKAGIVRRGRPAVVGEPDPPASLVAHAREVGADLKILGRDFAWRRDAFGWTYEAKDVRREGLPPIAFGGDVQYANAAACVEAVESLRAALPIAEDALRAGLADARLRGRTERHVRDGAEWIFDVAHNPAAAAVLKQKIRAKPSTGCTYAVFAAMLDKDLAGVLGPFVPLVDHWFLAQSEAERAAPVGRLLEVLRELGASHAAAYADVASACAAAEAAARPGDRVIVFGSFYTAGPALQALGLYSTPSAVGD